MEEKWIVSQSELQAINVHSGMVLEIRNGLACADKVELITYHISNHDNWISLGSYDVKEEDTKTFLKRQIGLSD